MKWLIALCCLAALIPSVAAKKDACGCRSGSGFGDSRKCASGKKTSRLWLQQCRKGAVCGCRPGWGVCDDGTCGLWCWTDNAEVAKCREGPPTVEEDTESESEEESTEESEESEEAECVVSVKDQLSKTACTKAHYSCTDNKLKVTGGCRAVFTCNGKAVKCESRGGNAKICTCSSPTVPKCAVSIKRQLSKQSCAGLHSCSGNKMTVKSGCRAIFNCNDKEVRCESRNNKIQTCTCPQPTGSGEDSEDSEEEVSGGDKGGYQTATGWFKTKSESNIKSFNDGVWLEPVKKPTTIHTYLPSMSFEKGDTFQISMKWTTDGYYAVGHESKKDFDCAKADPTKQGRGISDRYLRCLGGTGDMRVGFYDSGGVKVAGDTCEGTPKSTSKSYLGKPEYTCGSKGRDMDEPLNKRFDNYKGFQFRIEPHLSRDYTEVARLKEATNDCEPHINLQMWTRVRPGAHGLMSDQCQHGASKHCGFTKADPEGTDAIGFGPNAPFNEEYDVVLTGHKVTDREYEVHLKFANDEKYLGGVFPAGFSPEKIDTLAITFTNSMRRYKFLKIWDIKTKNIALPSGWKGYDGPPPSESTGCVAVSDSKSKS